MADIFGSNTENGQVIKLEGAVISGSDFPDSMIVESIRLEYQRSVSFRQPLNSKKRSVIVGRASGTLTITNLLGGASSIKSLLSKGKECTLEGSITISALDTNTCPSGNSTADSYTCKGLIVQGMNITAQDGGQGVTQAQGTVTLFFASLEGAGT